MNNILSNLIFLPIIGALIIMGLGRGRDGFCRGFALIVSGVTFLLSIPLYTGFREDTAQMQFTEHIPWIKGIGANYSLGIDGISLPLVLITTFLTVLAILASWTAITSRVREYTVVMLFLESGMLGVFCAQDLLLFYVFWEAMLIPMALLIGVWGGERRIYAAIKFVLFTMAGSVLMLVGILVLYTKSGGMTFDLQTILGTSLPRELQTWLFLAFFVSFAIKVPLFPVHTWLPDAHVEAPTAGSVILAGVLLKMGTYGLIRFCLPLFPYAAMHYVPMISALALIGIVYGALVSMVQQDIKKLVAYSSVSHLGFVVLGIFSLNAQGMNGAILQMVNHGLSTGGLFLIVGMIYERRHTREIEDYGGLAKVVPIFSTFFLIITLSSIGLPGLNGFVGEFLILVGAYRANPTYGVIAASGVILAAVYMLWMYQRVVFGEVKHEENRGLRDLSIREIAILVPIVAGMLWIGVYPNALLSKSAVSVNGVLSRIQTERTMAERRGPGIGDQEESNSEIGGAGEEMARGSFITPQKPEKSASKHGYETASMLLFRPPTPDPFSVKVGR